jgi:type I restriction-modification system DNA methylase subunit
MKQFARRRIGACGWIQPEPRWGSVGFPIRIPRVARCSQPWAGGCDPVGIGVPPTMPKYACRATREEIAKNDFNLNIPRYVDTFEEEKEVDLKALEAEIGRLEGELGGVRKQLAAHLKELGV